MDLMQDLQRQGWYLTENGIKDCSDGNSGKLDDVIRAAMDMDLKEIGEKHLPESLGKAKTEFVDGPFILQIQKVRNVGVPKEADNQDGGQKLMRLSLTDGQGTCTAVDLNGISGLSNNTPPGSKIKLLGRVPVNQGFLLLNKSNCKLLGGRVEKLVESWELKRALAVQSRASITQEGGPPPFIPFGQRRKDAQPVTNKRDNFRSLEAVAKKKELDCEFEQQRKAIIEAALQEGRAKSFASASAKQVQQAQDKNVASIIEMGFTVDQANVALRKTNGNLQDAVSSLLGDGDAKSNSVGSHHLTDPRHSGGSQARRPPPLLSLDGPERPGGRRRGGRADETEDYEQQHTKPSAPATLFDFVTTKIPSKSDKAASKSQHTVPDSNSSRDKDKPRQQSPDDASKTNDKCRQKSPEESTDKDKPRHQSPEDTSRGRTSPDEGPDKHQNSVSSASQNVGHGSGSSNHHNPVQNLPPRLQKKQLREEEEKMYKFHGKDSAMADWSRDRMSNKVYDVNSRGPVSHKSLWSDEKDGRDKNYENRTAQKGKPGDGKVGDGDKNYQRSTKDGSTYQMHPSQMQQQQQQQQPMHLMNTVKPLMDCTPCSVQPLMQCTTDGVQLIQSMGALQLYPAASIQVAQAPAYVHGHTTAPPSVVRDVATNNVSKESISWKMGDICLAKWRDKQYYRAKIIQTDSHFAFVSFIDYGNDADKVPYADLRPLTARDTNIVYSTSIPPGTSILYPEHGASMVYPSHNGHYSAVPVCSAGGPPSGILVQGPGAFPSYTTDHSYRIVTNSGRASGMKTSKRPATEKQLYIPPAQRK